MLFSTSPPLSFKSVAILAAVPVLIFLINSVHIDYLKPPISVRVEGFQLLDSGQPPPDFAQAEFYLAGTAEERLTTEALEPKLSRLVTMLGKHDAKVFPGRARVLLAKSFPGVYEDEFGDLLECFYYYKLAEANLLAAHELNGTGVLNLTALQDAYFGAGIAGELFEQYREVYKHFPVEEAAQSPPALPALPPLHEAACEPFTHVR